MHDQLKHELWQTDKVKSLPNRTWMDAVLRWIGESFHKRSLETDKYLLAWLDSFLRAKKLTDIDGDLIEFIAKKKEAEPVSLTTVNRVLD